VAAGPEPHTVGSLVGVHIPGHDHMARSFPGQCLQPTRRRGRLQTPLPFVIELVVRDMVRYLDPAERFRGEHLSDQADTGEIVGALGEVEVIEDHDLVITVGTSLWTPEEKTGITVQVENRSKPDWLHRPAACRQGDAFILMLRSLLNFFALVLCLTDIFFGLALDCPSVALSLLGHTHDNSFAFGITPDMRDLVYRAERG
jgi:hypothetical protein